MKGSRKGAPPKEFVDWLALENESWQPTFDSIDPPMRKALVASLLKEQRGLCVYCGQKLDIEGHRDTWHIEHFRPRNPDPATGMDYSHLEVAYNNLFLSCSGFQMHGEATVQICGHNKANWFDEDQHIEPEYPACTQRFQFMGNGAITPKDREDIAAQVMLDRLNLNHPELMLDRERLFFLLDGGGRTLVSLWDTDAGMADSYAHVAYERAGKVLP